MLACHYKVVISMTSILLTKKISILLTKNEGKYVKLVASATTPNDGTSKLHFKATRLEISMEY